MRDGRGAPAPVPFLVTGGGEPSDAEREAIARALARLAADTDAEVAASGVAAWRRAALTEATRRITISSPQELRR